MPWTPVALTTDTCSCGFSTLCQVLCEGPWTPRPQDPSPALRAEGHDTTLEWRYYAMAMEGTQKGGTKGDTGRRQDHGAWELRFSKSQWEEKERDQQLSIQSFHKCGSHGHWSQHKEDDQGLHKLLGQEV